MMTHKSDHLDGFIKRASPTTIFMRGYLYWAALSLAVPIALMAFFFLLDWIQHL